MSIFNYLSVKYISTSESEENTMWYWNGVIQLINEYYFSIKYVLLICNLI